MSNNASSGGRLKGIYKRGKKFWYRYSVDGHQTRVPLHTEDEGEAVTRALKILGNPLMAADPLKEELESFLAEKLEDGTYTSGSVDTRRAVLKSWMADRHLKEVRQVREDEIRLWLRSLRKGEDPLEGATIDSYGMMIRAFCGWLVENKKLRENPALFLKSKRHASAKRRRFCRREEMDGLIGECPSVEMKFILYAGFHGGLRKEEIIQARPEWFDLRLNILQVVEPESPSKLEKWKPKDRDKRSIPLSKAFAKFLKKEMLIDGELPGPFLLRPEKKQGKAHYRYDFRKPFTAYVASKKFNWLTPHIMRHTFASLLAIAGVSIFKIAKWLGDEVSVVERHYAHLMPQDADIERAFGKAKGKKPKEPGINDAL